MAEIDPSALPAKYLQGTTADFAFCRWLTVEKGVTAIPASTFFTEENKHIGVNFARFALCKRHDEYEEVAKRLG